MAWLRIIILFSTWICKIMQFIMSGSIFIPTSLYPRREKSIWSELESNPGPLASQVTARTTRPWLLGQLFSFLFMAFTLGEFIEIIFLFYNKMLLDTFPLYLYSSFCYRWPHYWCPINTLASFPSFFLCCLIYILHSFTIFILFCCTAII